MSIKDWSFQDGNVQLAIERKKSNETVYCLISEEDFELIGEYNWYACYSPYVKDYYIMSSWKDRGKTVSLFMHRLITDCPEGLEVDHINHKTTDNRRENLRICTRSENMQNLKKPFRLSGLTEKDFKDILQNNSLSDKQMAKKYNISQVLVANLRNGSIKKHYMPEIKRREKINNQQKLNSIDVINILSDNKTPMIKLAEKYNVHYTHIQKIKKGEKRKDLYNLYHSENKVLQEVC